MKIAIGSDHAGYQLKMQTAQRLQAQGWDVLDLGCETDQEKADHVSVAKAVCQSILTGEATEGILICGTGIGMSMVANRHPGIRAALANEVYSAVKSKEHNHANLLCLGARVAGSGQAEMVIDQWLMTESDKKYQEAALKIDNN